MFFYLWHITPARFRAASNFLGLTPRTCFHASKSEAKLSTAMRKLQNDVKLIPTSTTLQSLVQGTSISNQVSHTVFEISPADETRSFYEPIIRAVSKWVMNLLLTVYEERQAGAAREFYVFTKRSPTTAPLAGIIWERQVHQYLASFRTPQTFSIRSLRDGATPPCPWYYPGGPSVTFQSDDLGQYLLEKKLGNTSSYFRPIVENYASVDSLVYQPDELICLQITASASHPIKVSGLQDIQRCLKLRSPLAALRPSKNHPWRFIFVLPSDSSPTFGHQTLEGTAASHWDQQIDQYVLRLSVNDVWPRV